MAPGGTSAPGEKKGTQKAWASLSLRGNLSSPRNTPAIFHTRPHPRAWLAEGGRAVFHVPGCAEGLRVFV